jgi:hypothetical protein
MLHPSLGDLGQTAPPTHLRERFVALKAQRDRIRSERDSDAKRLEEIAGWLEVAPKVEAALEVLSQQLFSDVAALLEEKLTMALQEVLDQPIRFRAKSDYSRGAATVEFWIDRDGYSEDILRGQGGSVANVLSVGLRMFALARLDQGVHRRFLVLDEPDAWLRPDLVPRLVKIISLAGRELGFQTLLISHHDIGMLEPLADKVYVFHPQPDGSVQVRQAGEAPNPADGDEPSETPGALPLEF